MTTRLERAALALAVPLQAALDAELIDPADVGSGVRVPVAGLALTPAGTLHGGALSGVLELAGYLAVLPELAETEHAVTHAIATQLVGAARAGDVVTVRGTLVRRARTIAFVSVTASVGDSRPVAQSQITKSIVTVA